MTSFRKSPQPDNVPDTPGLRLSAVLACSLDAVITVDVDGKIIEFNPAAEEMFGITADKIRKLPMAEAIIPEKYRARHARGMQRYLESGESKIIDQRLELEGMRANGDIFDIELTVHATETASGERIFIAFIRDISERKHAQRELKRLNAIERESQLSKAKFQTLFDQSIYFAAVLTLDGTVTDVNQTALAQCGYQFEQADGRKFWDTPWWSGSTDVQKIIRTAIKRAALGEVYQGKLPYWVADGTERITDFALTPVHNDEGDVIFIVPTGLDVTEKHLSDLREQREAHLKRFLDDATVAVNTSLEFEHTLESVTHLCVPTLADWAFLDLIDDDGVVKRVAVAHANPEHAALAARVARFPARRGSLDHPPAQGLYGGKSFLIENFTEELLLKAAQSPEHEQAMRDVGPVSFVVVPLVARDVALGALTLIMSDSGRRHDETILRVAEEVARRAAIAVDNARLYRIGQQANAAKTEFIANVSHEIRTPMTAIMGYADLLIGRETDAEKSKFLQSIHRNGNFLLNIINDILDVSKIEAGQMETVRESFPLQNVLADVHSMMHLRAVEKQLQFEVEFAGLIPETVNTDPKRLRQILVNLIGNAIKFTDSGMVKLIVTFISRGGSNQMCFDVRDTGIGMTDEEKDRLFKPFSQGSELISRAFGGTGLGLAISQRLAEMLGGKIIYESEYGKGSSFRCTIDVGEVDRSRLIEPTLQLTESESRESSEPSSYSFSGTILVVDDQPDVRTLMGHLLEPTGAKLLFANDGLQAIKLIKKAPNEGLEIDLVLLDMRMPGLDGYQTAARLRSTGFEKPIIALTADAMHGDIRRCLAMGCDAYLSKPVEARKLFDAIDGAIHQTRQSIADSQRIAILSQVEARSAGAHAEGGMAKKILVVDDSEDACVAVQLLLQLQGYEVETAFDGRTAIEAAQKFAPDIVLLDISLPDMDGFAVLAELREYPPLATSRYFAMTGHSDIGSPDALREAGFERHLLKPVEIPTLLDLLVSDAKP